MVVVVVKGILFIRALALIYKMENEIGVQNSEQACGRFGVMMKNKPMSPTIIRAHHIIMTALICLMPRLRINRQTDRQTDREREGDVGVSIRLCRGGGKARGLVRYVRYNELFIQRRTSSVSERHGRLKAVVIININPILACAGSDAGPRLLLKLLLQTLPVHYQHPW